MFDYLIKNALIIDGSGGNKYKGSILIKGDRIEKILPYSSSKKNFPKAKKTIDAKWQILAPGFIDIHSHNDWLLPDPDHVELLQHLMRQGVTTVVTGQCGFSPAPLFDDVKDEINTFADILTDNPISFDNPNMNSFFEKLESNGIAVNMAHFAGHATLRGSLKGVLTNTKLSMEDMRRIEYALDESFDAGVFGLSFGLGYPPGMFSSKEELQWFANIAARNKGIVSVHLKALSSISPCYPFVPGGTPHNIMAIKEIMSIVKKAEVPVQVSHMIFVAEPTWKTEEKMMKIIEKEYKSGFDISFDAFPYKGGNTSIVAILPFWFLENFKENIKNKIMLKKVKIMLQLSKTVMKYGVEKITLLKAFDKKYELYEGETFGEMAASLEMDVIDLYLHIAEITEGKARILLSEYYDAEGPESIMSRVLSHPLCQFETDVLITRKGVQNPATYGTFPKILHQFASKTAKMTLETAIHKMTGSSARKIGIKKRGEIRKGNFADLVLFDERVINEGKEGAPPVGIEYVFINGKPVVKNNKVEMKKLYGKVIRKNQQ